MDWEILPGNIKLEENIVQELKVPWFIAKMIANRGVLTLDDAIKFVNPKLADLYDPFLMKGMKEGVEKIRNAIREKKSICIYGDYDTDGISATSLLVLTLQKLGAKVSAHIPHRLKEGYGLKKEILKKLRDEGVELLITVDCGITSIEEIGFACSLGMEVIVTDHHLPFAMLPPADVIINPNQSGCFYPFKELAGVGVAFKLCQALTGLKNEELLRSDSNLDLVALGTIADLVPLQGENRILVKYGLENFSKTNKLGLRALSEVSGSDLNKIEANHLGYRFSPRINAAGRMGDAKRGLNLLLSKNLAEARIIASMLNEDNRTRQKVQREVFEEAQGLVNATNLERDGIIVLSSQKWHRGVIGIVASRLTEEYNCPAVIVSVENGVGYASCRSVKGIDIMKILSQTADMFSSYGGHKYAAGFTIKEKDIDEFSKRIKSAMSSLSLDTELLDKFLFEAELDPGDILKDEFENWFDIFSPFGKGNPVPIFMSKDMILLEPPYLMKTKHLHLVLEGKNGNIEAIGYGMGNMAEKLEKGNSVDIIFSPRFDNKNNFQINLEDLKI